MLEGSNKIYRNYRSDISEVILCFIVTVLCHVEINLIHLELLKLTVTGLSSGCIRLLIMCPECFRHLWTIISHVPMIVVNSQLQKAYQQLCSEQFW